MPQFVVRSLEADARGDEAGISANVLCQGAAGAPLPEPAALSDPVDLPGRVIAQQ